MVILLVGLQFGVPWLLRLGKNSFELPWADGVLPEPRYVVIIWAFVAIVFGPIAEEIFCAGIFLIN